MSEERHRIDWAVGRCIKCGINHEEALDFAECVDPMLSKIMEGVMPPRPWPNQRTLT